MKLVSVAIFFKVITEELISAVKVLYSIHNSMSAGLGVRIWSVVAQPWCVRQLAIPKPLRVREFEPRYWPPGTSWSLLGTASHVLRT